MKRMTAAIDEYSPPWMPASRQRCGPSAAPARLEARELDVREHLVRRSGSCAARSADSPSSSTSGVCAAGRSPQAKWQAARCAAPGPASAGSSVEQTGSWAIGQRGWKRQPLGSWIGLGGSPTTAGAVVRAAAEPGAGPPAAVPACRDGGVGEQLGSRRRLDDPPEVHHRHAVADVAHDGHVVGDQQHRQPEPGPQVLEQVEDGRLHRDVERRDRLVGDEHRRARARARGRC